MTATGTCAARGRTPIVEAVGAVIVTTAATVSPSGDLVLDLEVEVGKLQHLPMKSFAP
jgi:hypothetical protein